jgi:hypothetical protein
MLVGQFRTCRRIWLVRDRNQSVTRDAAHPNEPEGQAQRATASLSEIERRILVTTQPITPAPRIRAPTAT